MVEILSDYVGDLVWGLGEVAFHVHGYLTTIDLKSMRLDQKFLESDRE